MVLRYDKLNKEIDMISNGYEKKRILNQVQKQYAVESATNRYRKDDC